MALIAGFAPYLASDPMVLDPSVRLKPPCMTEALGLESRTPCRGWFGTDHLGRDVYARTVFGARISLVVGLAVAVLATTFGLVIGLVAGYVRLFDAIVMRVMDGLMAIPSILLAIALMALFGSSVQNVIIAISVPEIPRVVRLVRAVVLTIREMPYVEAAVSSGTRLPKILFRHILPNTLAPPDGAGDLRLRGGGHRGGAPQLPRGRHSTGDPELGQHDGGRPGCTFRSSPGCFSIPGSVSLSWSCSSTCSATASATPSIPASPVA